MQLGLNKSMEKMHTLAERIKFAREAKDMTQTALAKKSGLKQSDISKLETGRMLSTTAMVELATALKCDPQWLSTGRGVPWSDKTEAGGFLIPIVGRARLGDDGGYFAEIQAPEGGDGFINWHSKDPDAYVLRCVGESMAPRIRHGEYVVVEPNHSVIAGDEVVVKDKEGRVMIKQLLFFRDGLYTFGSINNAYPPFGIDEDGVVLLHYIAGIAKSSLRIDSEF